MTGMHRSNTICHQRRMIGPSFQDRARKNDSIAVYSEGRIASQRTKELAPQWSMRTIKPSTTVTEPVIGCLARETGPEGFQDAADMTDHGPSFAIAKVLGAVRTTPRPAWTFFNKAETMESRLSSVSWSCLARSIISVTCKGAAGGLEYVQHDIDIRRTPL